MAMTHQAWQEQYAKMRDIAERIDKMRMDRARQACLEAGLDPQIIGIHVHNALCGLQYGKPWKGIDYSKVRLAARLMETSFEGYRIVEAWDNRVREINPRG